MSSTYSVDVRQRWRARSVILKRWTVGSSVHRGESVCELDVDGASQIVEFWIPSADDPCGVYWLYVREKNEVGPFGALFEYSTTALGPPAGAERIHSTSRARFARRDRYPRIFLSYRREDTEAYAGRLHESLGREFGAEDVFMDQFSIRPGEQFEWTIQQAAAHCEAMVCLIGPKWLTVSDALGKPRIDSKWDILRRETCAALDRGVPVIPVLVPNGMVPEREALPEDLQGFQTLQALPMTARHWDADVKDLVDELKRQLGAG